MPFVTQMLLNNGIRPPRSGRKSYRVRHCPALYLVVSSTGVMSWSLMLRVDGKQRHKTLGRLRDIPRLDDAVDRARRAQEKARGGIDPFAPVENADKDTLRSAYERWLKEHVERKCRPSSIYNYRRPFEKPDGVLQRWGDLPLAGITKKDIRALIAEKAGTRERPRKGASGGAVAQANQVLARLSSFFKWCVRNDLLAADPTSGVDPIGKEIARDRFLNDDEIRLFWRATGDGSAWSALFRLALLTGQRSRQELGGMLWSEVDDDARTWEIPGKRSKNSKAHVVHLSALAMAQLQALPRSGDRVFTAASFSRAKARIDEAIAQTGFTMTPWTTHDLRRTAVTLMAQIGVAPHIADRVLNHQGGTIRGVAATYNRFQYLDERRAALKALGEHVAALVGENVVELPKRGVLQ
jgi:integrase